MSHHTRGRLPPSFFFAFVRLLCSSFGFERLFVPRKDISVRTWWFVSSLVTHVSHFSNGAKNSGATALILSTVKGNNDEDATLKVDGVTDEFCSLVKTGDALDQLNAITKGNLSEDEEAEFRAVRQEPSSKTKKRGAGTAVQREPALITKRSSKKKRKNCTGKN